MKESEKRRIARELKISRPEWYVKKQEAKAERWKVVKLFLSTIKHLIALVVIAVLLIIFVIGAFWSLTQLF